MRPQFTLAVVVFSIAVPAAGLAQVNSLLNPTFKVPLTHPPQIVLKGVQKVAVREFAGDCGAELSDRLLQQLANTGKFEVIDRGNLDAVLQEQGLQASSVINAQSAVKIGQLLGPAAMFAGRVSRCTTTVSDPLVVPGRFTDSRGLPATKYVRRTTSQMTASVQVIDFATGKIHTARLIEARGERANEALNGYPEAPDPEMVKTEMFRDAIAQASRMILPWTEIVQIIVFDDNDKNKMELKAGADMMRRGDFSGAATYYQGQIDQGGGPKTTDKGRQRAQYDLGIALMYGGRLPEALPLLHDVAMADPKNITFRDGLAAAERMSSLEQEQKRLDATAVEFGKVPATAPAAKPAATPPAPARTPPAAQATSKGPTTPPPAGASKPAAAKGEALTNADIVSMIRLKLGDAVILGRIKTGPCQFVVTAKDLRALTDAGASDAIIDAMIKAMAK